MTRPQQLQNPRHQGSNELHLNFAMSEQGERLRLTTAERRWVLWIEVSNNHNHHHNDNDNDNVPTKQREPQSIKYDKRLLLHDRLRRTNGTQCRTLPDQQILNYF
mmetsp:Transcript_1909/g.5250  ORF Transcript_1909/g.5250 Transcript_1909/m.5250 type:complete len:105 (-) Transcript_1909:32-346(-)